MIVVPTPGVLSRYVSGTTVTKTLTLSGVDDFWRPV